MAPTFDFERAAERKAGIKRKREELNAILDEQRKIAQNIYSIMDDAITNIGRNFSATKNCVIVTLLLRKTQK